jgi:NADH-quinone oxidoreductase subunit H
MTQASMTLTQTLVIALIQCAIVAGFVLTLVPLTTFAERKVLGYLQQRLGATRVASGRIGITGGLNRGMWAMGKVPMLSILRGLPFFVADALKLFLKEDTIPAKADRTVFMIAPAISAAASLLVFAVVCFYPGTLFTFPAWVPLIGGCPLSGSISDINVGLLFMTSIGSVGVYGIVLGGWASNSKYPLLGGLRSAAQMVSYEVPLAISLLVPVVLSGSLNFREMMRILAGLPPMDASGGLAQMPLLAAIPLFIGFFIYLTCGFAETNRMPFDMPEAENELVAGFHTEYSGMRFSFFYLAEYTNMIVVAALASSLFLGGHHLLPFGLQRIIPESIPLLGTPNLLFFLLKIFALLFVFIWVRGTLPRYRYDQIMAVAWKYLLPLALANLFLAAAIRYCC